MSEAVHEGKHGSRLVADLALRLHREDGIGLRIDVPAGAALNAAELPDGCQLVDPAALQFDSLVSRNVIVARAAFEELQAPSGVDADALFERAYQLWRDDIGHSDQASGRLLALASVSMDILTIGAKRIRNGSDVFDVLHLVEAALPYLQRIQPQSIIDLFVAKYEPTKNDMAGGLYMAPLSPGWRSGRLMRWTFMRRYWRTCPRLLRACLGMRSSQSLGLTMRQPLKSQQEMLVHL